MNPEYQKQADADYECGYEMAKLKMERDEALDALEDLREQLADMGVHRSCYETAAKILAKHGRPQAGGAE